MEMLLAIVVASAVIFFGALISMGNERQRKAIDGLREQVILWAIQDLKIKREGLKRDIRIEDPLKWINHVVEILHGESISLTITEYLSSPEALICIGENNTKAIFSPLSPLDIKHIYQKNKSKLNVVGVRHPLFCLPKRTKMLEISILNMGILFDLEARFVWEMLTGSELMKEKIWLYIYY